MKKVFITGANKGIGFATAKQLYKKGFMCILVVEAGKEV
ncbi:SDR family NAD(P)-dependent oxidoreductase [Chryseobacterium fluminis]|nr:SDR family NAD(P)-dependent oxidoreductase [Chryseobacterium sp. MMS21-Ot14]UZT99011.1 SDR family NAD(P)-dependent oxidoreductase [Chryseobacterium sp. MMS21-Ot14]